MSPARYAALRRELEAIPASVFVADRDDCRALVRALAGGLIPQVAASEPATVKLVA
jgi:hypothetical protein